MTAWAVREWVGLLLVCLWTCGLAAPAAAQVGAGALTGQVSDQAGAAVPGATVTITAVGTNLSRTTATDAEGRYVVSGLAPGSYLLRLELSGFRPLTREGIRLTTGETIRLDLRLEVGQQTDAITVTGDAPLLRSEASGLGQVIDNGKIVGLPLNGRSFITLAGLAPGRRSSPGLIAATNQWGTAAHQRVSVRRHLGPATRTWPGRVLSKYRCHSGVQGRKQQSAGRVRALQRRGRQSDDPLREQQLSRHCLRILPKRSAERPELLRLDESGQAQVPAESVWRGRRRSDSSGSHLLFHRLPGAAAIDRPNRDLDRSNGPPATGHLHRSHRRARPRHLRSSDNDANRDRRGDAEPVPGKCQFRCNAWIRSPSSCCRDIPCRRAPARPTTIDGLPMNRSIRISSARESITDSPPIRTTCSVG